MTSGLVTIRAAAVAALVTAFALPALAAPDKVSQERPSADACTKTVNAMGAPMGHAADVAPDGRPTYRFVLRQNGLDYEVVCDAASGVVGDVTPRATH